MNSSQDSGLEQQRIPADLAFQRPDHLLRTDVLKEKLKYAKEIETCIRKHGIYTEDFRPRAENVAGIMVAPLSIFKGYEDLSIEDQSAQHLQHLSNRRDVDFLGGPSKRLSNGRCKAQVATIMRDDLDSFTDNTSEDSDLNIQRQTTCNKQTLIWTHQVALSQTLISKTPVCMSPTRTKRPSV
ncbi:hypothetical protein IL306_007911 [Fusarium sp. DS 682]|nr:hypothetical protein IL306_007911 [Fusarium sp. DS 682]